MKAFQLTDLLQQRAQSGHAYLEFIRETSLSVGLYVLPTGAADEQQPHTEDEVYYVVRGRGMFFHDGENIPVQAGSVLFVAAHVEHRFHSIDEDLHIIVFFAPAEYSQAG
ncbi:MAG: cupin domain-containing protein [Anaerolineae bacterium]|nr:cupin domain-containing protein [Anaerolineae bacterium]